MFDHLEYDFESLARGSKAEHRFRIKNIYRETIKIDSVRSSCGCTDPRVLKNVLASGEETELIAEFNTIAFDGSHQATITVLFAEPFAAEVRLKVRGYVRQDVVFTPGRIELGPVEADTGAVRSVKIAYAGRPDWEIVDVRSANRDFEVELTPLLRSDGRVEYEMLFRLKEGAPAGYVNDQVFLVTNDHTQQMIPLAVEGQVRSGLTVSPASLHLGVLRPGQTVTKRLVVRGTTPFRIVQIACEDGTDCFKFDSSDTPRKVHLVPVTFTAPSRAGRIVEKIKIVTDGSAGRLPTVVAQAEIRE
ncbi:MAG: DUF1573 domain-containing protein [Planctomycetales bacterium]|nr:DUF1573 domain-containing protein [Planctomycetales bacterium]